MAFSLALMAACSSRGAPALPHSASSCGGVVTYGTRPGQDYASIEMNASRSVMESSIIMHHVQQSISAHALPAVGTAPDTTDTTAQQNLPALNEPDVSTPQ